MDRVETLFTGLLKDQGIELSAGQLEQFKLYYRELVSWNEKMNLTGITEREEVYVKHFYDSVSLSFYLDMRYVTRLADIGSGAGFPSIPLKIVYPHLQVVIVDSLNKRIGFLNHLVAQLGLADVECLHGRAEEIGRKIGYRDAFDLVTARAVARLNVLNEFCLPFAGTGGLFCAMKGSDPEEEIREAERSMQLLNARRIGVHAFKLPVENAERHIVVLKKTGPTPAKFPRNPGTPLKQPLI
jgi:16S rRNA (guanine527-N7)-methyltransferase